MGDLFCVDCGQAVKNMRPICNHCWDRVHEFDRIILYNRIALLEAEEKTLRRTMENTYLFNSVFIERFHRYAKHLGGCTWDDGTKGDVCTCGFQGLINLYYEIQDAFIREKS